MKEWVEIKARGAALRADEAAYELLCAGSPGVVEEYTSCAQDTQGGVGTLLLKSPASSEAYDESETDPEAEVLLTGHLDPNEAHAGAVEQRLEALKGALGRLGWTFASAKYKDQDWSKNWRHSLKPIAVKYGKKALVVRSTWSKRTLRTGEIELVIDPSMAFGTGHHATTKLCLKALLRIIGEKGNRGRRVGCKRLSDVTLLDVGTGTGVLAIAAMKLGIGGATGIEIDEVSLKIARQAVRANGVTVKLTGKVVEKHKDKYPIVVANILSGELIRLSSVLVERLTPGGLLLLSGILGVESGAVISAFKELGLLFVKQYKGGEWVALEFKKASL